MMTIRNKPDDDDCEMFRKKMTFLDWMIWTWQIWIWHNHSSFCVLDIRRKYFNLKNRWLQEWCRIERTQFYTCLFHTHIFLSTIKVAKIFVNYVTILQPQPTAIQPCYLTEIKSISNRKDILKLKKDVQF